MGGTENTSTDRIVEFLTRENGLAEYVSRVDDVAVVLRCIRDDMVIAWQAGKVRDVGDVERWMNARIAALYESMGDSIPKPRPTTTGDTTEVES